MANKPEKSASPKAKDTPADEPKRTAETPEPDGTLATAKTPSEDVTPPEEKDPRGRNTPKAHDPERASITTSASARTRGAAQRTAPPADRIEARPRTGRESVDGDVPSPVTPKVQRNVDRFGDPQRVPDAGDITEVKSARIVIQDASAVVLTIVQTGQGQPSTHYRLDAQTLLALRRELDAAALAVVS